MHNIEPNSIVTIKLDSGEEVIAKFVVDLENYITIVKPLVIMMGPQGLAFGTWVATMDQDKDINIAKEHIMTIGMTNSRVQTEYTNATSSIKQPPKSNIIT
jgi:hypothetical protein